MSNYISLDFIKRGDIHKAQSIIPFFYYFLLYVSIENLLKLNTLITQGEGTFVPRWPIFWMEYVNYPLAVKVVLLSFLFGALLASFFYRQWWGRLVAFLGVLQFHALLNSFGVTFHQWDLWVWTALFFTLLPDVWGKTEIEPSIKEKFLIIFWGIQAFVLLMYTMSGIWKFFAAVEQLLVGEESIFSFYAPALHIATQFLKQAGSETSLFGPFIIDYPFFAWLPLIAVLYLQLFCFWVAFKPDLHRLWAFGLVAFHVGVYLTLYVQLFQHLFIILLLLADSPFRGRVVTWRQTLSQLPILGLLVRLNFFWIQKQQMDAGRKSF